MNEKEIVEEIIRILSDTEKNKRYFASDIAWFNDRLAFWRQNYIRIGLVGVTSCGKSTLLNAIMGDIILPYGIRPTSGIIVTCSKASSRQATVFYNNNRIQKISDNNLPQKITQLADEKYNPGNKKDVKYIDVRAPGFLFQEDVQIVDSPGLDAVDMEHHEKLTMEVLLPTVDICLYLCTLKANADVITGDVIAAIKRNNKPLVVVQNMLDSVEPKVGKNGVIEKTKEQVAEEHKQRVKRIIASVDKNLVKSTPVIQISAKQGINSRINGDNSTYIDSRIAILVETINRTIDCLSPSIRINRLKQIAVHLDTIIDYEKNQLEAERFNLEREQQQSKLSLLYEKRTKLNDALIMTNNEIVGELDKLGNTFNQTAKEISQLWSNEIDGANQILIKLHERVRKCEDSLIKQVDKFNTQMKELILEFNLNPRDYFSGDLPSRQTPGATFNIAKKTETRTLRQEKKGIVNKVKRFIGSVFDNDDWGWDEYTEEYLVIDAEATQNRLAEFYNTMNRKTTYYLDNWKNTVSRIQTVLDLELQRRQDEENIKNNTIIEIQQRQDNLEQLNKIREKIKVQFIPMKQLDQPEEKNVYEPPSIMRKRTQVEISEQVFNLYLISQVVLRRQFREIFSACQQSNHRKAGPKLTHSLVWGWDSYSLTSFIYRFTGYDLNSAQLQELYSQGITSYNIGKHRYIIVDEKQGASAMMSKLKKMISNHYNCYLLVDVMQYGSMMKQLQKSRIVEIPAFERCIKNWVSQSFTEYKVADNIEEWVKCIFDLRSYLDKHPKGHMLVNDSNPIYSLIMFELSSKKHINYAVETEYIRLLTERMRYLVSPSDLQYCSSIMQGFSSLNTG